jgi:hypothetical protein
MLKKLTRGFVMIGKSMIARSVALLAALSLAACNDLNTINKAGQSVTQEKQTTDLATEEALFVDTSDDPVVSALAAQTPEDTQDIKKRFVKINFNVLKRLSQEVIVGEQKQINRKLKLNVFADEDITVLLDQVEKLSDENIIFTGQIAGDLDSAVTLVMNHGAMAANIRHSDKMESYEIRTVGNFHSVALRTDEESSSCEEVEHEEEVADNTSEDTTQTIVTPRIDILGAYTPNARIKYGGKAGIVALIQMGVADTNRAFADSGINLRARLAGTLEVKTNETGNWSNDLYSLSSKSNSKLNEVHTERARLGADQTTLVATYPGSSVAGIGYINSTAATAFTIVKNTAFSQFTFSHELGHNLGLRHTDGYVNSSGRFRTIIAYGSYPRIRRYSSPSLLYNGYRTGDSAHNETNIIIRNATIKAAMVVPTSAVGMF